MAFEADHGLTLDGVIGSQVWRAMFRALAAGQVNTHGYTYGLASQKPPETLTVWHSGRIIFHHLANTGIPAAPTAVGTDPVYLRYRHQIMRGRNPDGTKYADPVAWVAYFHAGEAVHYFPRYSYGSQQSLGCVELPWGPAKRIWPYMTFGTLVTVTAP
jgi:L,D-transpeptidase catalytic domain